MGKTLSRRDFTALAMLLTCAPRALAEDAARPWAAVESEARGQIVYFNAWAGSEPINAYIAWVGREVERSHGIRLEQVKIAVAA